VEEISKTMYKNRSSILSELITSKKKFGYHYQLVRDWLVLAG